MTMVESYEKNGSLVVTPRIPRIDAMAAPTFRTEALAHIGDHRSVYFVMDRVETMDSTGLGSLVAVFKAIPPGAQLRLVGLSPAVRTLLKLTRLDRIFAQYERLEDALAA